MPDCLFFFFVGAENRHSTLHGAESWMSRVMGSSRGFHVECNTHRRVGLFSLFFFSSLIDFLLEIVCSLRIFAK